MYMELTPQDTLRDLTNLLIDALPGFEFPRQNIMDFSKNIVEISKDQIQEDDMIIVEDELIVTVDRSSFKVELTEEEINIIAILMMKSWVQRQVTSIENIRMKYSGSDFKFTSQANHLSKLMTLLENCNKQSHHMQRLYKRRRLNANGQYESNWDVLKVSRFDY